MPRLWKEWKAKGRLPTLSTSLLGISPKAGEIPTFPQLGRSSLEKWKTKIRFPTFPAPLRDYNPGFASQTKTRPLGGLRPPSRLRRSAPPQEELSLIGKNNCR